MGFNSGFKGLNLSVIEGISYIYFNKCNSVFVNLCKICIKVEFQKLHNFYSQQSYCTFSN